MVSIIMSAYNAESTIVRAIQSVLINSYKDWELIVINDGSTDNTKQVVGSIDDSRIILIDSKHIGTGKARNLGIEAASGDYIMFLDSDDMYAPNYISTMVSLSEKHDADLVCGSICVLGSTGSKNLIFPKDEVLEGGIHKYDSFVMGLSNFLCPSISRRKLWEEVRFPDRCLNEDTPVLVQLIYYANKRILTTFVGYIYIQREDSITHISSRYKKMIYDTITLIDNIEFFKDKEYQILTIDNLKEEIGRIESFPESIKKEYKKEIKFIQNYIHIMSVEE